MKTIGFLQFYFYRLFIQNYDSENLDLSIVSKKNIYMHGFVRFHFVFSSYIIGLSTTIE